MDEFYYDAAIEKIEKTEETKNIENVNTVDLTSPAQIPKQSSIYTWVSSKTKKPIYIDSDSDEEAKEPTKNEKVPKIPVLPIDTTDVRIISGVKVEFPVKPYGPQIAIMDKVRILKFKIIFQ